MTIPTPAPTPWVPTDSETACPVCGLTNEAAKWRKAPDDTPPLGPRLAGKDDQGPVSDPEPDREKDRLEARIAELEMERDGALLRAEDLERRFKSKRKDARHG